MSNSKRLHPIAAVTNFIKQLKELIIPFIAFFVFGTKASEGDLWFFTGSIAIVIVVLGIGVLNWLRFSYRLEEGELRMEYGLLVRKKRYIPFDRIQSLDFSEGILHRPFGLVKVKVETAGSSGTADAEAVLTAITKDEANRIQEIIAQAKGKLVEETFDTEVANKAERVEEKVVYKISSKELLLLATTSGGVGVVLSAMVAFLSQLDDLIPYESAYHEVEKVISNGIVIVAVLVFLGFLLAWVAALIGTMVKFAQFTVKKTEREIIISRGLLEKRQITIPLNRIQAIRISENILRQPFGLCSVYMISAGGSVRNAEGAKVLLLPAVKKAQVAHILQEHLPISTTSQPFNSPPKRSLPRYLLRGSLIVVPFVIAAIAIFKLWGLLSILLFVFSSAWSYLIYKDAGWGIEGQQLNIQYRGLIKHTLFMKKPNVQSLDYKESIFQRRKNLATMTSLIKSGMGAIGGTIVDIEKEDAKEIYQWYSHSQKAPF
ncbi:PH domain-containing protein [Robertmurraya korlensis]|uniref:PH domain-containing protein n=1 Tax=Robertmurraya korlensis TaxID=519977 RepID=UPI00203F050C|nr:PH domain-containing protein [Robertmurraya korlensis]MCM3603243.1 PH domain-containing protein [Robertmurraya korlensis]